MKQLPTDFREQTIMVFGDIIADIYEYGTIRRLSREAPIPIVEFESEKVILGGAGNVIANISSLGGTAVPVSIIGADEPGNKISNLFKELGANIAGILPSEKYCTTTKRRILAQGEQSIRQQILRLDRLPQGTLDENSLSCLWDKAVTALSISKALIISDYLSDQHHQWLPVTFLIDLITLAKKAGKVVVVDSRHRSKNLKGMTLLTPNRAEASEMVGMELKTTDQLKQAGMTILKNTESELLIITLGDQGMALFQKKCEMELIPAFNRQEVFDVSGAGDTVVAAVTLGLLSGMLPLEATKFANIAAGLVVRKIGTATVSLEEINDHFNLEIKGGI